MDNLSLEFSLVKAKIGTKTIKMSSYDIAMIKLILSTSIRRYTQFNIMRLVSIYLIHQLHASLLMNYKERIHQFKHA